MTAKKFILSIAIGLVIAVLAVPVYAAMTQTITDRPNSYWFSGNYSKDSAWIWAQEVETYLEGTAGVQWFYVAPRSAVPTTVAEGVIYYDSDNDNLYVYANGAWVDLTAGASGITDLDSAYGGGIAITVDAGAVALTATNAANNVVLALDQQDTGSTVAQTIVSAGTGALLSFDSNGTGPDVLGSDSTWTITKAGVLTAVSGDFTGAAGLTLQNDATITNATDAQFDFTDGGEVLGLYLNANNVYLKTTSGLTTVDVDQLTTITRSGASGEDFTVSQSGAADTSLILSSTGTAADALQITTTAGGIDITNGGAAGGEDIDINGVLASVNINADEDVADAVVIGASAGGIDILADGAVAKDLDLGCTNGSVNITAGEDINTAIVINASTGGIDITADGAAAKDLDLVCTNGSTNISGGEADAAAVTIAAGAGGIDITSAATYDIDITSTLGTVKVIASEAAADQFKVDAQGVVAGNAINLETTDGGIILNADGTVNGDITFAADSAISLVAAGGAAEDFDITNTAGSVNISGGEADAAAVTIAAPAGGVDISAAATFDIDVTATGGTVKVIASEAAADQFKVDAQGVVAGNAINLETTDGGILLNADGETNGDIGINAASVLTVDSVGGTTITQASGAVAATDLSLIQTGAVDASILLTAAGTGADAIGLTAAAGGITLNSGTTGINCSTDILLNYTKEVADYTADETIEATQSGAVITNNGDTGIAIMSLPTAAVGLTYTFCDVEAGANINLVIKAADGDTINGGGAAQYYMCATDAAGQSVTLVAVSVSEWIVTSQVGTWVNDADGAE